jgi:hypothetical protein
MIWLRWESGPRIERSIPQNGVRFRTGNFSSGAKLHRTCPHPDFQVQDLGTRRPAAHALRLQAAGWRLRRVGLGSGRASEEGDLACVMSFLLADVKPLAEIICGTPMGKSCARPSGECGLACEIRPGSSSDRRGGCGRSSREHTLEPPALPRSIAGSQRCLNSSGQPPHLMPSRVFIW